MPARKGRRGHNEGSIFYSEKRNEWLGQLFLGYNANGKPRRATFYGKTRQEVKQKMEDRKVKMATHTFIEKKEVTVYDLAEEIIMDKINANLVIANTHRRDLYTLNQLKDTDFANMNIQDVKPIHIKKYLNTTIDYANSSIVKIFRLLKKVFRRAVDRDLIIKNPMLSEEVVRPKSNKPDKKVKALTKSQLCILGKAIKGHKYENIILLMIYTGMRIGEVLALSIDDIHDNYIFVSRTMTRDVNDNVILGKKGKTVNATRKIHLTDKTYLIIKEALKDYTPNKNKLLFYNEKTDRIITPGNVNSYLKRINETYHIAPNLHNHMLRHSYATICNKANLSLKSIQNRLGHADIQTTMNIYVEETEDTIEEDDKKLDALFDSIFKEEDNIISFQKRA